MFIIINAKKIHKYLRNNRHNVALNNQIDLLISIGILILFII